MIGILALQGAFLEHIAAFTALGVATKEVRTPAELDDCDALVIPGGESTAISLIAQRTGVWEALKAWVASRKPVWGTCAGMVLLAERTQGGKAGGQALLGGVDVEVHRNYFGSQLASFQAPLQLEPSVAGQFDNGGFTGVFIRAPAILNTSGTSAVPLAWVRAPKQDAQVPVLPSSVPVTHASDSERVIVAVQQGPFLVTAFHPELTGDHAWHRLFAVQVERAIGKRVLGQTPAAQMISSGSAPGLDDSNLTPGTSPFSSFKHAAPANRPAPSRAAAQAAEPSGSGIPRPIGLVGSDEQTGGHALSHAIAHRVILYPPTGR